MTTETTTTPSTDTEATTPPTTIPPAAPPAAAAAPTPAMPDSLLASAAATAASEDAPPATPPTEPAAEGAPQEPVSYEPFTLPAGVTIDETALGDATSLFRAARLDQATAQKFVDLAMAREQAGLQRGLQAFTDLQARWTGEVRADPEIGGARLPASLRAAARALDHLGVDGLRQALHVTGAGNHPAVVRAFVRLGHMLAEDRFQPGHDGPPPAPRSPADVIYGGDGPRRSADDA